MTTYKGIKGISLQTVAGDPGTIVDGLIWYDSIARKVQGSKTGAGTWASGGAVNTGRVGAGAVGASNSSALIFGGTDGSGTAYTVAESYDGSSWTEVADTTDSHMYCFGLGTVTAGLAAGGYPNINASEEWDGSSWAEGGTLSDARGLGGGGAGTQTAGLVAGGYNNVGTCETYDGSSWTEVGDLNTGRNYGVLGGATQNTAIITGKSPASANTETFNGTSWTEVGDLNTGRGGMGRASDGSKTDFLVFGGTSNSALTESFDGSSWSEVNDLNTGSNETQGSGATNSAIKAAGNTASAGRATTEECSIGQNVKTITD